mgnify:FL=1
MLNLSLAPDREALEKLIKDDINSWCEKEYLQGHRDHLGASLMGDQCSRKLWYNFHWCKAEKFSGRMLRLFQVGHKAEERFVTYLRGIGFEVFERDPETNKQFRISGANGHYGGSLDGQCKAPARYNISENMILEFKTNGTGAGFKNVEKNDLSKSKPTHFAQMSQYGFKLKLQYGLYLIENKNDSDLIVKVVKLDWELGQYLENKATNIISSKFAPAKISENPSYQDCQWCSYSDICHNNAPVEINCRSCKHCEPVEAGEWKCHRWNNIVPKNFLKVGCKEHQSINVNG